MDTTLQNRPTLNILFRILEELLPATGEKLIANNKTGAVFQISRTDFPELPSSSRFIVQALGRSLNDERHLHSHGHERFTFQSGTLFRVELHKCDDMYDAGPDAWMKCGRDIIDSKNRIELNPASVTVLD